MRISPLSGRFDAHRYVFGAMPAKAQARLGEYPFPAIAQLTAFLVKPGSEVFPSISRRAGAFIITSASSFFRSHATNPAMTLTRKAAKLKQ